MDVGTVVIVMKAAVCVLVTIESDSSPGKVTANFGSFVLVTVVVDGDNVVVVLTATVARLVVVLVDPSSVTVDVIVCTAPEGVVEGA